MMERAAVKFMLALVSAGSLALAAHGASGEGAPAAMAMPRYTPSGQISFPTGYREWQFVTAGHGMNYNEAANAAADPPFDNVFVQPEAYQAFKQTGHWPEGTMLVLEIRSGTSKGSIVKQGAFQHGAPVAVEAHVRDKRVPGGWAFYGFGVGQAPATMLPSSAPCYTCHQAHGAVDTTFVQFYPTLLPIATAKATLSAAYLREDRGAAP